jgi:hypothetical protein
MKSISKQKWITWAALFLSLPTGYFILIAILKYVFGIGGPFDASAPLLEELGIKESLGWNINLLILLGPVAASILTAVQVLKIKWNLTGDKFEFHLMIRKQWFPILVAAFSISLLAILFLYLLGENCNCQNF